MRKILLTSAGFETKNIENTFLKLINKEINQIKTIFVPTAAINPDAIAVLPECMNDLLKVGILPENIVVYDLHFMFTFEELCNYDVIYFTGGNTQYLLDRINDTGFNEPLKQYINNGGIYIGVSAGSIIAGGNLPKNLGYINCTLDVHVDKGSKSGTIDISKCSHISLTNNQAILIQDDKYEIIE
jgi:peptidase E